MTKVGKYNYEKSPLKNKKLRVVVNGKVIDFGDSTAQHYFDKSGLLDKKLNHGDKKRQASYLARSAGIKNKKGELTKDDPLSPNYHSRRILWGA